MDAEVGNRRVRGMYDSVVTLRARRGFNADGTPKHTCRDDAKLSELNVETERKQDHQRRVSQV